MDTIRRAAEAAQEEIAVRGETRMLSVSVKAAIMRKHRPAGVSDEEWKTALRAADIEVERRIRY